MKTWKVFGPVIFLILLTGTWITARPSHDPVRLVAADLETDPVPSAGDAADDPAIWISREDPAQSAIIGTDKDSGLIVYDFSGNMLQFLPDGNMNNVDLRDNFPLGGRLVTLVTASDRYDNSIAIYRLNALTRTLEDVAARKIITSRAYGSCMYRSPVTRKFYYLVTTKSGNVEQWELYDNGAGQVDAKRVRIFDIGHSLEGCVADDGLAHLYIGLQRKGIRKYGAEPADGIKHTVVDKTGWRGHLVEQVEGLSIYFTDDSTGYLVASSQGRDEFVVYRREGENDYVGTFKIVAGNGIDAVTHTDGIDVINHNLGSAFPAGIFVAHDHLNDAGNQNFKIVSWQSIAAAVDPK